MLARAATNWTALAKRIPGAPPQWTKSFSARGLTHRAVASGTAGLWRIAQTGGATPISFVVKRLAPVVGAHARWQATTDPSDPFYWGREALAFETGFFGDARTGIRAAACYLIDRRDDAIDLYLEDVAGEPGPRWDVDSYARAAERLGRFQAAATLLPNDAPWLLGRRFFATYLARREDWYDNAETHVRVLAPHLEHERLREYAGAIHDLWARRERIDAFCAALPVTRCHNDFWSPNLFALPCPAQTVAIDLAYAGLGPPGHDPANLVADAVMDFFVPAADAERLWQTVATAYGRGLASGLSAAHVRAAEQVMLFTAALKFAWLIPATFHVASTPEGIARAAGPNGDPSKFFRKRSAALRFVGALIERSLDALRALG